MNKLDGIFPQAEGQPGRSNLRGNWAIARYLAEPRRAMLDAWEEYNRVIEAAFSLKNPYSMQAEMDTALNLAKAAEAAFREASRFANSHEGYQQLIDADTRESGTPEVG